MTTEFSHYPGCRAKDPDNCSGCALVTGKIAPNYAAWPLVYMENGVTIPSRWLPAFMREMQRTDNPSYARNVRATAKKHGARFSNGVRFDGKAWTADPAPVEA